jgi:hypothetical protein
MVLPYWTPSLSKLAWEHGFLSRAVQNTTVSNYL